MKNVNFSVLLNIILILIIIFIGVISFTKSENTLQDNNLIKSNTNLQDNNLIKSNTNLQDNILTKFQSKENLIARFEKEKNGDYIEEIPRIESYFTSKPFFEFYILLSIYKNDSTNCLKIKDNKSQKLCLDIFNNVGNKKNFLKIYLDYGENKDFSNNMYNVVTGLKEKKCKYNEKILGYLMCRKILEKDLDIRELFLKYSILEYSDPKYLKENVNYILNKWQTSDGFRKIVYKNLLP